jgi:hypothetical protein
MPVIREAGCEVVSAEITDRRLYIKALSPKLYGDVKVGDRIQAGVLIQNSEIGCGRLLVAPLAYRLVCKNGLVVNELAAKRNHVGRRATENDLTDSGIYSRETVMMDVATFLMKARDAVKYSLTEAGFGGIVNQMKLAAGIKIEDVEGAIENVTGRYSLSNDESAAVLRRMVDGGDTSRYGLVNAITAAAHLDVSDYDRSVELEAVGGQLLFA